MKRKKRTINDKIAKQLTFKRNQDVIVPKTLLDYERIPTEEELKKMRNFASNYKKLFKKASNREIRRETQAQFHCRKID